MVQNNIIITSDSTTDLSPELRERYGISVIPLGVTLGDKNYLDGVSITPDEIYAHYDRTGELPKTSGANIGDCIEFFKPFAEAGKTVIHFTISSDMSSTYSNCLMASREFESIYVIDTKNLSTGGGLLCVAAAEMAANGASAEEIVKEIESKVAFVDTSFVIDNLEYLYKGGRCSALAMLGANLLKLKPCIEVKDGVMVVGKKYRGKFGDVVKAYVSERLSNGDGVETDRVFVTHAGCDDETVNAAVTQIKSLGIFKEVFTTRAGATISSHCGANTLGVLFIRKNH